jgi:hypothetical protein
MRQLGLKRLMSNGPGIPLPEAIAAEFGYCLHPEFSEWLMGFPLGWTLID